MGLPNALSLFRIAMVPVLGALAWLGEPTLFLYGLAASLLSDVVDGYVARRSGAVSALGARLDSLGDLATYTTLPLFAWWLWPGTLRQEKTAFLLAAVAYLVPIGFGWMRFRRLTSYHTWAAKLTAVWMGGALLVLFGGGPVWPFHVGVALLVLEAAEEIAITCVLPAWKNDVPTLWHALRMPR
ncbi:MAG TPA: CDP-alcohol phosphatidyltransferase family protein [Myxococcota bacterium]|nr:CDP-alcohol phosphatidyltransferase family protein [Myxococcota bacterium]